MVPLRYWPLTWRVGWALASMVWYFVIGGYWTPRYRPHKLAMRSGSFYAGTGREL